MPRLGPCPVDVVTSNHMQVRAGEVASQPRGVGQEVDVLPAQPHSLAASQPRPTQHQHQQPVARRTARTQQCHRLLVAGSAHSGLGDLHMVAGSHPQPPRAVLTASLRRQAPAVGQFVELPHHPLRGLTLVDRERQESPNAGQNSVDPPRPTHLIGARTGQHHRRARPAVMRRGMPQPQDEQPQPIGGQPPIQMCHNAPRQIQRHRTGVTLGRRLGIVAAEPHIPQIRISDRHRPQVVVDHRPVPGTRGKPHRE
jgi:hypothetical protein